MHKLVSATNSALKDAGLPPLHTNTELTLAAQQKANDMVSRGYFSHTTPDGNAFWDFILNAGYSYQTAGENLAVSYKTLDGLIDGWINSPGHKANILGAQYSDIGIGIAYGERKGKKKRGTLCSFLVPRFSLQKKVILRDKEERP